MLGRPLLNFFLTYKGRQESFWRTTWPSWLCSCLWVLTSGSSLIRAGDFIYSPKALQRDALTTNITVAEHWHTLSLTCYMSRNCPFLMFSEPPEACKDVLHELTIDSQLKKTKHLLDLDSSRAGSGSARSFLVSGPKGKWFVVSMPGKSEWKPAACLFVRHSMCGRPIWGMPIMSYFYSSCPKNERNQHIFDFLPLLLPRLVAILHFLSASLLNKGTLNKVMAEKKKKQHKVYLNRWSKSSKVYFWLKTLQKPFLEPPGIQAKQHVVVNSAY